jgi:hypothetical protein
LAAGHGVTTTFADEQLTEHTPDHAPSAPINIPTPGSCSAAASSLSTPSLCQQPISRRITGLSAASGGQENMSRLNHCIEPLRDHPLFGRSHIMGVFLRPKCLEAKVSSGPNDWPPRSPFFGSHMAGERGSCRQPLRSTCSNALSDGRRQTTSRPAEVALPHAESPPDRVPRYELHPG